MKSRLLGAVLSIACGSVAQASSIGQFLPQGNATDLKEVRVTFAQPVVQWGDAFLPAPVLLQCDDPDIQGQGRWLDSRRWIYEFTQAPGPGLHCVARVAPDFRDLQNKPLTGQQEFSFTSGGPALANYLPSYSDVSEDQIFLLQFNTAVAGDSLKANSYCLIEGLGEKVPTRLVDREQLNVLAQQTYLGEDDLNQLQGLQCQRSLPPGAKVSLLIEPGVETEHAHRKPVASSERERLDFTVRQPFSAYVSCTRERQDAPCTPVADVSLQFSAPVPLALLQQVRLVQDGTEWSPLDPQEQGQDNALVFSGPFAENSQLRWKIPADFSDDMGRPLSNLGALQDKGVQTAAFPPLLKFAAAPFAIVERFAHAEQYGSEENAPPALALNVRRVEPNLVSRELLVSAGQIQNLVSQDDLQVLQWYSRLQRADVDTIQQSQLKDLMAVREYDYDSESPYIDLRSVSLLDAYGQPTKQLLLPGLDTTTAQEFEVIGVPLKEPGFHVLEIASERLGSALLEEPAPMYVRSSALVTNLGVHIKQGLDDVLVWVTSLDDAQPIADAQVRVMTCNGSELAQGKTDAQGLLHLMMSHAPDSYCSDTGLSGLYVTARIGAEHAQARGKDDFSFAFSTWDRGIEPWRFQVPYRWGSRAVEQAHTIFDRSLFLAGETVHMKHYYQLQNREGFSQPKKWPTSLEIRHQGSDKTYTLPLKWQHQTTGSVFALSEFKLPAEAPLGVYELTGQGNDLYLPLGQFRVEEFKLPWLKGSIKVSDAQQKAVLVAPSVVNADLQLEYVAGGAASYLPATLSAVVQPYTPSFKAYSEYSFDAPTVAGQEQSAAPHVFLNKKPVQLDENGGVRVELNTLPPTKGAAQYLFELSFADPNGQIQTISQTVPVWPALVQVGLRTGNWLPSGKAATFTAITLGADGQVSADIPVLMEAYRRVLNTTRKRLVGGFYGYDSVETVEPLGVLCEGRSDKLGLFQCSYSFEQGGDIEVKAVARDAQGKESVAVSSVWVSQSEQSWFGGEDDDRIDLIPERKIYAPGDVARFQVRMPFREATALVSVEREGVLHTQVMTIKGDNPVIELPVQESWGPNVYVSALVLRGRLREVPWYSFFSWGWKRPSTWYQVYQSGSEYIPPTQLIDLSKPAYRFGLGAIQVSAQQDALQVQLSTARTQYGVREKVQVRIQVNDAQGKPAAHTNIAFAAVDAALLELSPNYSWDLLQAMRTTRPYGVQTATAQSEIVGRRHYGRKALPAGGGGGKSPTRELLDTLLLWEGNIQTDEQGLAKLSVPLNDVLSRFVLVAVAEQQGQRFGTGQTEIVTTQEVQLISGLPAVVRDQDHYQAQVTVRNSSERSMHIALSATYQGNGIQAGSLPPKQVQLAPGKAATVMWPVQAPTIEGTQDSVTMEWRWDAKELDVAQPAQDSLLQTQRLYPTTPITVQQAALLPISADKPLSEMVQAPNKALLTAQGGLRGGIQVNLLSSLAGPQPGVQQWFEQYPYTCFEQQASRFMGLGDAEQWASLMLRLPAYMDQAGLLRYFPSPRLEGSVPLTAYVLDMSDEAQRLGERFTIPEAYQRQMLSGLQAYALGRGTHSPWLTPAQLQQQRLAAIATLARYGQAQASMLDSLTFNLPQWPTASLLDLLLVHERVPGLEHLNAQIEQASTILQGRLHSRATRLYFDDNPLNQDPWSMVSRVSNQAKLILLKAQDPRWSEDMPRLFQGLLAEQRHGAWRMTTENLLGSLAVKKFALLHENPPSGQSQISLAGLPVETMDWDTVAQQDGVRQAQFMLNWPVKAADLQVSLQGQGRAWAQLRSLAAVPVSEASMAGIEVQRTVSATQQAKPGQWSVGDTYKVQVRIRAQGRVNWAVLSDPIPAGATIMGSGLGRDSALAAADAQEGKGVEPSFVERKVEMYRAYFNVLPEGETELEYVVRLNTAGLFALPPTRIEALYEPDVFGVWPNSEPWKVGEALAQ